MRAARKGLRRGRSAKARFYCGCCCCRISREFKAGVVKVAERQVELPNILSLCLDVETVVEMAGVVLGSSDRTTGSR